MSTHDGGPAFPVHGYTSPNGDCWYPEFGMTLRDYFAAKALQSGWARNLRGAPGFEDTQDLAHRCYEIADAMLKARQA